MVKLTKIIEKIELKRKILKILENGIPEGAQQIGSGEYIFSRPSKKYVSVFGLYPDNRVQITAYEEFKPNQYRQVTSTKFISKDSNPTMHSIGVDLFKKLSALKEDKSIDYLKENHEMATKNLTLENYAITKTKPNLEGVGLNLSTTMSEEFHKFDKN